jgi:lysozyme
VTLEFAIALCKHFEGLYLKPYLCPAGIPTIGYGATYYEDGKRVSLSDPPITPQRAEELLLWELNKVSAPAVIRLVPELFAWSVANGKWRPFCAIVDFTFNLGAGRLQTSTLRRKLRALDWEGSREQLLLWVRGGGKVLPGLVRRRQAECSLLE